jgi:hypothetical protein
MTVLMVLAVCAIVLSLVLTGLAVAARLSHGRTRQL